MKAFEKLDDNSVVLNAVGVNKDSHVFFLLRGVLVEGWLVNQFIDANNNTCLNIKHEDITLIVDPEDVFLSTSLYESGQSLADKPIAFMPHDGEVFDYNHPSIKIKKFTWSEDENKPVEKEVECNSFYVYNNLFYKLVLTDIPGEHFSWDDCVKWNDYKFNDGSKEVVVKSAHKHTLLTEYQKGIVEEFRSLLKRMNDENIAIMINTITENFEFYNTKEYCVYSEYDSVNEDYQQPINHGEYQVKFSLHCCEFMDGCSTLVAEEKK